MDNNKKPLGVTMFGIGNIIFGLFFLMFFLAPFLMLVILGWVTDREFYGWLHWFFLSILDRIMLAIFYIFSFLFFFAGVSLLKMKPNSRKLAISTSIITSLTYLILILSSIISSLVYPQIEIIYQSPDVFMLPLFLIYTILLIAYFNDPGIKKQFNDENVKLSFKKPVIIIFISLIFPFIIRLFFLFVDWLK